MSQVKTGTEEYERHKQAEIEHYKEIFAGEPVPGEPLFQPVPPVWKEIEGRAAKLVRDAAGHDCLDYLGSLLRRTGRENRMLSLGSGPGWNRVVAGRGDSRIQYRLRRFQFRASRLGSQAGERVFLAVTFEQGDLNTIELPKAAFDIVFCHASLHHVIELERLMAQIRGALRPGGQLVVLDVITRSGYLCGRKLSLSWRLFSEHCPRYCGSITRLTRIAKSTKPSGGGHQPIGYGMHPVGGYSSAIEGNLSELHYVPYSASAGVSSIRCTVPTTG